MNTKILTIAVAAYNMEKYLPRCIDSLLASSNCQDIEVLIINDGSKDSTLSIALAYQKKYPDTVRVIDKENGGYGSAINVAIDLAQGKYFKTLDADDWFDSQVFDQYISKLRSLNVDLILTNYSREVESTNKSYLNCFNGIEYEKTYDFSSFCIFDKIGEPGLPMHAITYRTEILLLNDFRLSECYYSDVDYSVYPLVSVKKLIFLDLVLYKYLVGREGQSISTEGLIKHLDDFIFVCKRLVKYYTDNYKDNNSVMGLNIGYNAGNLTTILISIILGTLYPSDKVKSTLIIREFMSFLRENDEDIQEIARERVYYWGKMQHKKSLV